MTKPAKSDVLAEINRLRAEYEIGEPLAELPKGAIGDRSCCPIANALGPGAEVTEVVIYRRPILCNAPPIVADFVRAFDAGGYPELELK